MKGVSGTSKTGRIYRYYYCLNQRKKLWSAKSVRKDMIEERVVEIVESFLDDTEMLASLAVDMAHHYRETHPRGQDILKGLGSRRSDVEAKLANFVKAIAMGIMNDTTAQAMASLEEQKKELDAAIQAEHVKATLFEDEASIGTFYRRFALATMDTPETRELLFDYFVDKIFVGAETLTIASWFFNGDSEITHEDLAKARKKGEVSEFATSPGGGSGGVWFQVIVHGCCGSLFIGMGADVARHCSQGMETSFCVCCKTSFTVVWENDKQNHATKPSSLLSLRGE